MKRKEHNVETNKDVIYRKAKSDDKEAVFVLAKGLATSFDVNEADFSNVFKSLLDDKNVDLIVVKKSQTLLDMYLYSTIQLSMRMESLAGLRSFLC